MLTFYFKIINYFQKIPQTFNIVYYFPLTKISSDILKVVVSCFRHILFNYRRRRNEKQRYP